MSIQAIKKMVAALEVASNGVRWYIENVPEANGCDDEALQQIDSAIAAGVAAIEAAEKVEPVVEDHIPYKATIVFDHETRHIEGYITGGVKELGDFRPLKVTTPQPAPAGMVLVPVEPVDALLLSMAIRYDHGLGIPDYYDQPLFSGDGITHRQRLDAALSTMRQLHEEVVGTGFYKPFADKEMT